MISLFDLHCDTLLEVYNNNLSLEENNLHISLNNAKAFSPYYQVMAIWSDFRLTDDEAYYKALDAISRFKHLNFNTNFNTKSDIAFILSIEDARILNYQILRLNVLYSLGVRVLTLNWKGESCIGGGYDTEKGLTAFGKEVVKAAGEMGIIIDISHSSNRVIEDVLNLANKHNFTPIASHSCAFSICNHRRNLTNEHFVALKELGSLVGVSLVPEHLGENASFELILKHIYHYLKLGGENSIALGCDFDGVSSLPYGISGIIDLKHLYYYLEKHLSKQVTKKLFFDNAFNFFKNNLI